MSSIRRSITAAAFLTAARGLQSVVDKAASEAVSVQRNALAPHGTLATRKEMPPYDALTAGASIGPPTSFMQPEDNYEMLLTLNLPLNDNDMKMMMLETQAWRSEDGRQSFGLQKAKSFVINVTKDMAPPHDDGENGLTADCVDAVVVSPKHSPIKDLIICEVPGDPLEYFAKAGLYICAGDVTSLPYDAHSLQFSDCQVLPPAGKTVVQVQIGSADISEVAMSQLSNITTRMGPDYMIGVPAKLFGRMAIDPVITPAAMSILIKVGMVVGSYVLKLVSLMAGVACTVASATEFMSNAYETFLKSALDWGCDWQANWACAANQAYVRLVELQQETWVFHQAACVLEPIAKIASATTAAAAANRQLISTAAGKQKEESARSNSTVGPSLTDHPENPWSNRLQVSIAKLPLSSGQMAILRGMRMGGTLQQKTIADEEQLQFITASHSFTVEVNEEVPAPSESNGVLVTKCIDAIVRAPSDAPHKNLKLCGMPHASEVRAGLYECVGNVYSIRADGHSMGYVDCKTMQEGTQNKHLVQVQIQSGADFDLAVKQIEELAATLGPDYLLSVPEKLMSQIQQRSNGGAAIEKSSAAAAAANTGLTVASIGCKMNSAVIQLEQAYRMLTSGVVSLGCWVGYGTLCDIANAHQRLQEGLQYVRSGMALTCNIVLPLTKWAHAEYMLDSSTCEKDTGGTCSYWGCDEERQASCVDSRCMCGSNSCAIDGWCLAK